MQPTDITADGRQESKVVAYGQIALHTSLQTGSIKMSPSRGNVKEVKGLRFLTKLFKADLYRPAALKSGEPSEDAGGLSEAGYDHNGLVNELEQLMELAG